MKLLSDIWAKGISPILTVKGKSSNLQGEHFKVSYQVWRQQFITKRLRIWIVLMAIANPMFILADLLMYRANMREIFILRITLETIIVIIFFLIPKVKLPEVHRLLLFLVLCVPGVLIAQMTVVLDGFVSLYYQGFTLTFLANAVLVPVMWPLHLTAQLIVLGYYYSANFLWDRGAVDLTVVGTNSFFIFSTPCITVVWSLPPKALPILGKE